MSQVKLFGTITSKTESYEDPVQTYPYKAGPKRMKTKLHVELAGYQDLKSGAAGGGGEFGTIYVTVDGTSPLASINAGQDITLTIEQGSTTFHTGKPDPQVATKQDRPEAPFQPDMIWDGKDGHESPTALEILERQDGISGCG